MNRLTLPPNTYVSIVGKKLHFKQPAGTSREVYFTRDIWYVIVKSNQNPNRFGMGECAPLPNLSCDASPDYAYRLGIFCRKLERKHYLNVDELRQYPSMLFGLETAIRHYEAGPVLWDTPFSRGEAGIQINGLIWMDTYAKMLAQIEEKMAAGFRCIKIKIGAIDFEQELALLKHIRRYYSAREIEIRVDANGAFSPDDAMDKLTQLAKLNLHSIEQPIAAGQWADMRALTSNTPIPIALDEELIGVNTLAEKRTLLDVVRPQYIILKPSLHGGFSGCTEWINLAKERNIGWWVTSALESNVGLNAIAQWCATYNNPLPQGLGTGRLFADNVMMPLCTYKDSLFFHRDLSDFLARWNDLSPVLTVQTSGSTGSPRQMVVRKDKMEQSARITCSFLGLKRGDKALLCLPLTYIAGKMMVVRALTAGLELIIGKPNGHPLADVNTPIDFVSMTPMQAHNSIQVPQELERMKAIKVLLIGGGPLSDELEQVLKGFPNVIYATYGMTETLSQIALRKLSGGDASEYYTPFSSVKLSLDKDGALVVDAPLVCDEVLHTNDLAELLPDGRFKIIGRKDNMINTGGLKMQIEVLEEKIRKLFKRNFAITSVPDAKLGEAIVLLTEIPIDDRTLAKHLTLYERPRHILTVKLVPLTTSSKIDRAACKKLAVKMMGNGQTS